MEENKIQEDKNKKRDFWSIGTIIVGVIIFVVFVFLPNLMSNNSQQGGGQVGVGGGPADVINQEVELSGIPVQNIINDKVFWVGPNNFEKLLVVKDNINQNTALNKGDKVNLKAVIKKMPSADKIKAKWAINDNNLAASLENQQIYLSASSIDISQ